MKINMKRIAVLVMAQLCLSCFGQAAETNILALGDWSEPVANKYHFKLRGRLLICEYPQHRGPNGDSESALYVELQEYSDFVGAIGEVYWNPSALNCELVDASGKPLPNSPSAYGGPVPSPCWIMLPSHSSMRLRVSPYAGGRLKDGGFEIWTARFQVWTIKPDDTNTYSLSGAFTVDPPTNRVPADFRYVWQGTLNLPRMKVGIKELKPQPQGGYSPPAAHVSKPTP
jgi:hypothetical protein